MGKIDKKNKYLNSTKAQSTLEYALIFPLLFLMVLAILELGMMWHKYNTIEMTAQNISANLSLDSAKSCLPLADMTTLLKRETALLEVTLAAPTENPTNFFTYTSNEHYADGEPFFSAKIDCTQEQSASVQESVYYKMTFFAASLPNLATGEKIEIIPNRVKLTSNKITTQNTF